MGKQLSIIVPVYNVQAYIKKCIQSILSQKFKDFELILIDDGSKDKSGYICDEYAKLDTRIKVIHKENEGLSSARNIGLKNAEGEYIGFVDSDDWIHENMYYDLINTAINEKSDIVQCKYIKVFDKDTNINLLGTYKIKNYKHIDCLYNLYDENYPETVVCWNKIYKRELFNDIEFPLKKIHEDEFTTHKVLYKAKKFTMLENQYYFYRQRDGSIMSEKVSYRKLDKLEALKEKVDFMKDINEGLYLNAIKQYLNFLRKIYFIFQEQFPRDTKLLQELRKESRRLMFIYLYKIDVTKINKLSLVLFCINPNIQKYIKQQLNTSV